METPHFHISSIRNNRSETYGIAERAVRRLNDGTPAVLLQSGLDERWWSVCCYGMLWQSAKRPRPPVSWKIHMNDDLENHSKGQ